MQIIIILKIFKDFFACKIVLDANHHYPEIIETFFRLQNCLRRKLPSSWKYSKTFSPAKLSSTQITIILKIFKDFFACIIVLDANHHYPGNFKDFFSCKLSWPQIIIILKIFKDFFDCKIVLDANHQYPEVVQRFLRWQNCLRRKSSSSIILKIFKDFFACKILLDANHHYPLSWKYSKTFSPAKLS